MLVPSFHFLKAEASSLRLRSNVEASGGACCWSPSRMREVASSTVWVRPLLPSWSTLLLALLSPLCVNEDDSGSIVKGVPCACQKCVRLCWCRSLSVSCLSSIRVHSVVVLLLGSSCGFVGISIYERTDWLQGLRYVAINW